MTSSFAERELLLVALAGLCGACASLEPSDLTPLQPDPSMPVFVMRADDARENGIEAVFSDRREDSTEVTVVFADEDRHGVLGVLLGWLFEGGRLAVCRRRADVESFEMMHPEGGSATIRFAPRGGSTGTHAGDDAYDRFWPTHELVQLDLACFEFEGDPVLYVTTWNHMFRESDNGLTHPIRVKACPHASACPGCGGYPAFVGSRDDVEAAFR